MAFDFIDKNKDGTISREEFERIFSFNESSMISKANVKQLFSKIDKNNDNKVWKNEFIEIISNLEVNI